MFQLESGGKTTIAFSDPRSSAMQSASSPLFVGVDVSKASHIAAFLSPPLLTKHKRFDRCPTLAFPNERQGFEELITVMSSHVALEDCAVLLEHTGHYHLALMRYLQERGIAVFVTNATKRMSREKTDKRDAQNLANAVYSQIGLGAQVADETQRVRHITPPSGTALALHGLVHRRYELAHDARRRINKLIAINDEMFPEFTQVLKNVCTPTALRYRRLFPTPRDLAEASIERLIETRGKSRNPSRAKLEQLHTLAATTIGAKHPGRVHSLAIEQQQLIDELTMLQTHIDTLDAEIAQLVSMCREGKILLSLGIVGPDAAATIIAAMGNIVNFERASKLRAYLGWAPTHTQTGTSKDSATLTRGGSRLTRRAMYLVVWRAIKSDTEWRALYERLMPLKCKYNARTKKYEGRNKVIGRLAGAIIGTMYSLLRRDYDMLEALRPGEEIPEPTLYSREKHRAHRQRGGRRAHES